MNNDEMENHQKEQKRPKSILKYLLSRSKKKKV